jgi:peptidoglycan/LPS O-acetylase OafA/YrhL
MSMLRLFMTDASSDRQLAAAGSMNDRLPTLDCLRGVASLAVMWFHFTRHMTPHIGTGTVYSSGKYGWLGVQVFFVISGFVIPYSMRRASYTISCYGKFLLKRITRLDPPYLLSIVLILSYQYMLTARPNYQGESFQVSLPQLLCHVAYLNVVFGYEWFNGVFWSLAIEFQYYLLVGLLFPLLFSRGERCRLSILLILLLLSFIPPTAFIFSYLGFFLLGFVTLFHHLNLLARKSYLAWLLVLIGSLVFTAGLIPALIAGATAALIAWVRFDFRILSFFGLISYSLYLLHWPLGLPVLGFVQSRTGSAYVTLAATVTITVLAAFVYYVVIERPSQVLASFFSYRSFRERTPDRILVADHAG